MKSVALLAAVLTLTTAAPSVAQDTEATQIDDVVVLARRSGAPMWTVTKGDSTLILVGAIRGIPREVVWHPERLEEAAARADLILTPQVGEASFTDLFRLIWRMRTISRLPEGTTTATYLPPEDQARLEAVMAGERNDGWRNKSLLILGFDLMQDKAGYGQGRTSDDATEVVRRAGRRARVTIRPVGTVRGDEIVESLISAPQTNHVPCIHNAITAAEQGTGAARERAEDWRAFRVADVVDSHIDQALSVCWPWADPEIGTALHQQWAAAIETAMVSPGVTMGVAPIRLLGEEGGVLDGLVARGFEVEGPVWK